MLPSLGRPVVVCPPIATFTGGKASEKSLFEGLALSVELDQNAGTALSTLRSVIGQPTLVVESGGIWTDPATGEIQPKLHVHYRLSEPTQSAEEHRNLKRARSLACELVGADATSKPAVHPMRWPGTLHRKDPANPKQARIVEYNPDSEIDLDDALGELEGLEILRSEAEDSGSTTRQAHPTGDDDLLHACAARITNSDLEWAAWNRLGMAFWRASEGSEAGFAAFDTVSRKSSKYDAEATRARWAHYRTSPPDRVGAPTLVFEARKADPGFRRKKSQTETKPGEQTACHDAAFIEAQVRAAGDGAPFVLAGLMPHVGDMDAITRERLRNLAAKLGKVSKTAVKATIEDNVGKARTGRDRGAQGPTGGRAGRSGSAR